MIGNRETPAEERAERGDGARIGPTAGQQQPRWRWNGGDEQLYVGMRQRDQAVGGRGTRRFAQHERVAAWRERETHRYRGGGAFLRFRL